MVAIYHRLFLAYPDRRPRLEVAEYSYKHVGLDTRELVFMNEFCSVYRCASLQ